MRIRRLVFFGCLMALAPLWLSGWMTDTLSNARGPAVVEQPSAPVPGATPADDAEGMFLAATDHVERLDGTVLPSPAILSAEQPAPPATPVAAPEPRLFTVVAGRAFTPQESDIRKRVAAEKAAARPKTRTMRMLVTAYCPCERCCAGFSDGVTACGRSVYSNRSRFVAADTRLLPFGKKVSIPGYYDGVPVPVYDRGGRIKGRRLDVFFLSHSRARKWGARWLNVTVYD